MTLHQYFKQEMQSAGNIDHLLRVKYDDKADAFEFYIHPHGASGSTADFVLFVDPQSQFDLLMPADSCRPVDPEKFKKFLKDQTLAENLLREIGMKKPL